MKKFLWFFFFLVLVITNTSWAQWAQNKNAREDAKYARVMEGTEEVVVDGVEEDVWAKADSVMVGYGLTSYIPGGGYNLQKGQSIPGDSANAVCKFLYKAPHLYLLFKIVDKSVGGRDWEQSDNIIMAFKEKTADHSWVQAWDKRVEHFYSYIWIWDTTAGTVGDQPWFRGSGAVGGGPERKRTENQKLRWTAVSQIIGGTANDSLPDEMWISEHRIRVDSLGFDTNGDILPFSFSVFDGDRFLDSTAANDAHTKAWWGVEWNENWYYASIHIDPTITTATTGSPIPPVDYVLPHVRNGATITVDGDISEWQVDNTLHARAKYGDEAAFDSIKGTGSWGSGYQQMGWNDIFATVIDGPEIDLHVTWDDQNLYVAGKVTDQVVTVPQEGRKEGISFIAADRKFTHGSPLSYLAFTVEIDSAGNGVANEDLILGVDSLGVEFALKLANGTDVNDISEIDSGYTVELKIPFAALNYPETLGDSVVLFGAYINDVDVFEDANANTFAKTWWFKQEKGQKAPAWVALGPANPIVGVNDQPVIPTSIELYANYPNPFNPSTTIKYALSVNADVTLSVYNTLGQVVSQMKKTDVKAGYDEFQFNASGLASGIYFYKIEVKNLSNRQTIDSKVNKMILLK